MSTTVSPSPAKVPLRDQIIADAQSLPDLIARAQTMDPTLARALKGQATILSATPAGALIGGAIGMLVSQYGLGWDANTVNLISGLALLAGGYFAHWVQARVTAIVGK